MIMLTQAVYIACRNDPHAHSNTLGHLFCLFCCRFITHFYSTYTYNCMLDHDTYRLKSN